MGVSAVGASSTARAAPAPPPPAPGLATSAEAAGGGTLGALINLATGGAGIKALRRLSVGPVGGGPARGACAGDAARELALADAAAGCGPNSGARAGCGAGRALALSTELEISQASMRSAALRVLGAGAPLRLPPLLLLHPRALSAELRREGPEARARARAAFPVAATLQLCFWRVAPAEDTELDLAAGDTLTLGLRGVLSVGDEAAMWGSGGGGEAGDDSAASLGPSSLNWTMRSLADVLLNGASELADHGSEVPAAGPRAGEGLLAAATAAFGALWTGARARLEVATHAGALARLSCQARARANGSQGCGCGDAPAGPPEAEEPLLFLLAEGLRLELAALSGGGDGALAAALASAQAPWRSAASDLEAAAGSGAGPVALDNTPWLPPPRAAGWLALSAAADALRVVDALPLPAPPGLGPSEVAGGTRLAAGGLVSLLAATLGSAEALLLPPSPLPNARGLCEEDARLLAARPRTDTRRDARRLLADPLGADARGRELVEASRALLAAGALCDAPPPRAPGAAASDGFGEGLSGASTECAYALTLSQCARLGGSEPLGPPGAVGAGRDLAALAARAACGELLARAACLGLSLSVQAPAFALALPETDVGVLWGSLQAPAPGGSGALLPGAHAATISLEGSLLSGAGRARLSLRASLCLAPAGALLSGGGEGAPEIRAPRPCPRARSRLIGSLLTGGSLGGGWLRVQHRGLRAALPLRLGAGADVSQLLVSPSALAAGALAAGDAAGAAVGDAPGALPRAPRLALSAGAPARGLPSAPPHAAPWQQLARAHIFGAPAPGADGRAKLAWAGVLISNLAPGALELPALLGLSLGALLGVEGAAAATRALLVWSPLRLCPDAPALAAGLNSSWMRASPLRLAPPASAAAIFSRGAHASLPPPEEGRRVQSQVLVPVTRTAAGSAAGAATGGCLWDATDLSVSHAPDSDEAFRLPSLESGGWDASPVQWEIATAGASGWAQLAPSAGESAPGLSLPLAALAAATGLPAAALEEGLASGSMRHLSIPLGLRWASCVGASAADCAWLTQATASQTAADLLPQLAPAPSAPHSPTPSEGAPPWGLLPSCLALEGRTAAPACARDPALVHLLGGALSAALEGQPEVVLRLAPGLASAGRYLLAPVERRSGGGSETRSQPPPLPSAHPQPTAPARTEGAPFQLRSARLVSLELHPGLALLVGALAGAAVIQAALSARPLCRSLRTRLLGGRGWLHLEGEAREEGSGSKQRAADSIVAGGDSHAIPDTHAAADADTSTEAMSAIISPIHRILPPPAVRRGLRRDTILGVEQAQRAAPPQAFTTEPTV